MKSELTVLQSSVYPGDPHICSDSKNGRSILFWVYASLVRRVGPGAGGWVPSREGLIQLA